MNEFELIQRCFMQWSVENQNLLQGIGDDCLVWSDPEPLVISTDTAVCGRHFPSDATPEQVANRAFLPAISDLAAMTATPAFFTLALTLPTELNNEWVERFAKQLRSLAERYQMALAGGDTTSGATLTVTISVHGTSPHPVLRSGAVAGDDVWVTGELGLAAAALPFVLHQNDQTPPQKWLDAYWQPEPPISFAAALEGCIHSAIDISDGLVGDAKHIAQRSQKTLKLSVDELIVDADLKALGEQGLQYATAGGDDYQLLFTASQMARKEIQALAAEHQVKVTRIGVVEEGKAEVCWYDNGRLIELPWQSFTHF